MLSKKMMIASTAFEERVVDVARYLDGRRIVLLWHVGPLSVGPLAPRTQVRIPRIACMQRNARHTFQTTYVGRNCGRRTVVGLAVGYAEVHSSGKREVGAAKWGRSRRAWVLLRFLLRLF
jgi:hypothetical protein